MRSRRANLTPNWSIQGVFQTEWTFRGGSTDACEEEGDEEEGDEEAGREEEEEVGLSSS
jgi:hypothetical protein